MKSKQTIARLTGFLYLLLALIGPFSLMYVPTTLIVPGDAAATAANIAASESLFRAGLLGEALIFLIEVAVVVLLYVLLKSVSETWSLAAALSRLAMAVIQGVNVLIGFGTLLLSGGAAYLAAFSPEQLQGLMMLTFDLRAAGALVWEAFFSLHLLLLGYLFFKSGYVPRVLGIMLVVASFGYLIHSFGNFLFPAYAPSFETLVVALTVIPELSLTLWLLIRGVKVPAQEPDAAVTASPAY